MVPNTGRLTVAIRQELQKANTALCSTYKPDLDTAIPAVENAVRLCQELLEMLQTAKLTMDRVQAVKKGEVFDP